MKDDKDKALDKSLLGFVVDTNSEDKSSDEEFKNKGANLYGSAKI